MRNKVTMLFLILNPNNCIWLIYPYLSAGKIIEEHCSLWISPPFRQRGKVSNVICLKICPHLVLICSPAEKPKTTFYCLWSNSKFILPWDDQTASLPQAEKVCLSLPTCSIIINSENCHIPFGQWKFHHWWPFGWGFCRQGPKSCRAPHTFSRSFALFPCLMTVA